MAAGSFQIGVVFDENIKTLFKKKAWNDALKAAMTMAGRTFIRERLPVRFTKWSVTALGYNAKKLHKDRSTADRIWLALDAMKRDGTRDALVKGYTAAWGGWDPYGKAPAPAHIWRTWSHFAFKAGKITKQMGWGAARKQMREECKASCDINGKLWTYARDVYTKDDTKDIDPPLIASGWLFKNHQRLARTEATATSNNWALRIPIPRQDRVNKWVNRVLNNYTSDEAADVGSEVRARMQAFVNAANVEEVKRGKNKGQKRMAFSKADSFQMNATRKNADNDRIANAHKSRKATNHKERA